jgi:hypothetical protein
VSKTDDICEGCRTKINNVFNPGTGTRDLVLISGERAETDCCFVADEIIFDGNSQLVFDPTGKDRPQYCREYFVICRKLTIRGGREGKDGFNPCNPEDPGQMYNGNNVITWRHRLKAAADGGPPAPPKAGQGTDHDRDTWSDVGQGNNGADGGVGNPGAVGQTGGAGFSPTPNVAVIALEVDIATASHLTIDFDGQNGGRGGLGQEGGDGGDGMGGREGSTQDNAWPGDDECGRQPGNGGDGGDGGPGGRGGEGGRGGNAGRIVIVSTAANVASSGVFLGGHIHYVNDGGEGGKGGKGGKSGVGGKAGKRGQPTAEHCEQADAGDPGEPQSGLGTVEALEGPTGPNGAGAGGAGFEVVETGTCADIIPFPPMSITSVTPSSGAQGSTVQVAIVGVGFNPAASGFTVEVSGIGVTAAKAASPPAPAHTATLTTWDLTIGGLAPKTARKVTVKNSLVQTADLDPGFTVT